MNDHMNVDQRLAAAHEELSAQYRSKHPDRTRIKQLWVWIDYLEDGVK